MNEIEVKTLVANQKNEIKKLQEDNVTLSKQNDKLSAELEKDRSKELIQLRKDNALLSKRVDKLGSSLNDSDKESLDYQKKAEDLTKKLEIAERSGPVKKGPEYTKVVTTADLKNVRPYRKPLGP